MSSPRSRTWLARAALLALALAPAVAACADETGIIAEVTRDVDNTPATIERLRFFVGIDRGNGFDFTEDDSPVADITLDAGRDLAGDPYRLLLRDGMTGQSAGTPVMVAVVAFQGGEVVAAGGFAQPMRFVSGQVLLQQITLRGDLIGDVNITATGCLRWQTDAGKVIIAPPGDLDCDSDAAAVDCNDNDPSVGPSQPEKCANGVNDDCDLETDEQEDADTDGVGNCDDCDDTDGDRFPGNPEVCDAIDNDCNGPCDDGALDFDDDQFNICGTKSNDDGTCDPASQELIDCNDRDPDLHPFAEEPCDGVDNDCNQVCDDGFDPDGDLYTECGSRVDLCAGVDPDQIDCQPGNPDAFPGAPERCDGVDDDCDGAFYPPLSPCYGFGVDGMGLDVCRVGTRSCRDSEGEGWGECEVVDPAATQEAPPPLCEAYHTCDTTEVVDPFGCANDAVAAGVFECMLLIGLDDGLICGEAAARLPVSDAETECLWTVVGGGAQAHYQVGLRGVLSGTVADALPECQVDLMVLDQHDVPALPDSFFLWRRAGTITRAVIRVAVTPTPVELCPADGGALVCASVAAGGPLP